MGRRGIIFTFKWIIILNVLGKYLVFWKDMHDGNYISPSETTSISQVIVKVHDNIAKFDSDD